MIKSLSKDWRAGRTCVFQNHLHLVFVTKYRRDVLSDAMLIRLHELLTQTCLQLDCQLLEFNGEQRSRSSSRFGSSQNCHFQSGWETQGQECLFSSS